MAYMNQEKKKFLEPAIKAILVKYGIKGRLGVRDHSTLVLNIKSGKIDFIKNYNETIDPTSSYHSYVDTDISVNTYHYDKHFSGVARDCLKELIETMNVGNHDNSDIQTDYFDVGWYIDINIGKWNKPYILT